MPNKKKYSGIVVPMVTPFTEKGTIDEEATVKIANNLIQNGAAPFLFGTTGEGASISHSQREKVVKKVVDVVNKMAFVYVGISSNSIDESIESAGKYIDYGADVVVAHLPSYYPLTSDQMLKYYETLVEKISGPLILYNITATTHLSIPLDVVEKLSHHPRIVGLKDSERDFLRLKKAISIFKNREDFSHLIGWGAQSSSGLILGSDGLVPSTGNIIPWIYKELYDTVLNGNISLANSLQEQTNEISSVYQDGKILGQSLAALKLIMNELGLCEPHVIPPLTRLKPEEEMGVLKNLKIIRDKYNLR